MHEHPQSATSWQLHSMRKLKESPNAIVVDSHLCQFDLWTTDKDGAKIRAKKPTRFITNSPMIAKHLSVMCDGTHAHGHLLSGRAGPAAKYTQKMCRAIVEGVLEQKRMDGTNVAQVTRISSVSAMKGK